MRLTRRSLMAAASLGVLGGLAGRAPGARATQKFGIRAIEKIAWELASRPYQPVSDVLPPQIAALDFDGWRQIAFRPDKSLFPDPTDRFRLQAFHLGHLFRRAVHLNAIRDGKAQPIPYRNEDFDAGNSGLQAGLPADLGHAGWRFNYPLNAPDRHDELISFLGSSYFRFLGQGQVYGLSARGLSLGTGLLDNNEEFPFFRDFWFEAPEHGAGGDTVRFYALLDSPSLTGAYQFDLAPGEVSTLDVTLTLFARKPVYHLGVAPLTSMYFIGENDRHYNDRNKYDDYRPEMHDSDGLRMHFEGDDWIWRPLRNPQVQELSYFHSRKLQGFGLLQRDREFAVYQDIELAYHQRPSYWVEPLGDWGPGRLELVELATKDETADNIVVAWLPTEPLLPERPATYSYRISAGLEFEQPANLAQVVHTFHAPTGALGSKERRPPGSRRFMVDFSGGPLPSIGEDLSKLKLEVNVRGGRLLKAFMRTNAHVEGVRAFIDVVGVPVDTIYLDARLNGPDGPASETWSYRWKAE
ncbi:glucan biosynthesis protein G [Alsobacter sp. SYSU M60028]|uniref:Glucan biosynthesis protein G n=1 Tax=Alsobacter ponti TaxID=2962936 RepID=A0ABT1LF19_9HYPH|nr:glucan biosynthesis protein G [Alsobacter ponti]MCP8940079.1 glucan biosynthesis protein G [Alsobacter ponti]